MLDFGALKCDFFCACQSFDVSLLNCYSIVKIRVKVSLEDFRRSILHIERNEVSI